MAAKKTVTAPVARKPVAPAAPARPVAPVRPVAAAIASTLPQAPASAPARGPGRPKKAIAAPVAAPVAAPIASARPAAPGRPVAAPIDVAALVAKIDAQNAEIVKLQTSVAKAKPTNVRTREEIETNGLDGIAADDWRAPYHGHTFPCLQSKREKDQTLTILEGAPAVADVLMAIPQDDDVGGHGTHARASGLLAIHWRKRRDGSFQGAPEYFDLSELTIAWAAD